MLVMTRGIFVSQREEACLEREECIQSIPLMPCVSVSENLLHFCSFFSKVGVNPLGIYFHYKNIYQLS